MVLVSYDVSTATSTGARRLRRLSRMCLDFGQRVQYSVFEIEGGADKILDYSRSGSCIPTKIGCEPSGCT